MVEEEEDVLVEALDDFWWAGAGVGVRDRLEGEGVDVAVEGISLRCLDMLNKAAVMERQTKDTSATERCEVTWES